MGLPLLLAINKYNSWVYSIAVYNAQPPLE